MTCLIEEISNFSEIAFPEFPNPLSLRLGHDLSPRLEKIFPESILVDAFVTHFFCVKGGGIFRLFTEVALETVVVRERDAIMTKGFCVQGGGLL